MEQYKVFDRYMDILEKARNIVKINSKLIPNKKYIEAEKHST